MNPKLRKILGWIMILPFIVIVARFLWAVFMLFPLLGLIIVSAISFAVGLSMLIIDFVFND